MAREVTKRRVNFTIDKSVDDALNRFCKSINMSKSAYVEHLIKDSLVTTVQLFSSTETLSEAIVILSNQISDIKKLMESPDYLEKNKKFNEVRNDVYKNNNQREG